MTTNAAVSLRVYDISAGAAKKWSSLLIGRQIQGVWHSGIEVYGYEYFYGGGIVKMRPENVELTFGISPAHVHRLGGTSKTREQFEKFLVKSMPMFRQEVYNLTDWNCNHFTNYCAEELLGKKIPSYILDLPQEVCKTFMGKLVLNFVKMMSGGSAPIGVDDPNHPSKQLGNAHRRRNSCPAASPSVRRSAPPHLDFRTAVGEVEDCGLTSTTETCSSRRGGSRSELRERSMDTDRRQRRKQVPSRPSSGVESHVRRPCYFDSSAVNCQCGGARGLSDGGRRRRDLEPSSRLKRPDELPKPTRGSSAMVAGWQARDQRAPSSSSIGSVWDDDGDEMLPLPSLRNRRRNSALVTSTNASLASSVPTVMVRPVQNPIVLPGVRRVKGKPIAEKDTELLFSPAHKQMYEFQRDLYAPSRVRSHIYVGHSRRHKRDSDAQRAS